MDIAVLMPTLHRPEALRRALKSLDNDDVTKVVACDPDDPEAQEIADDMGAICIIADKYRAGCAYAWNLALRAYPEADAYVMADDDVEFDPKWLRQALERTEGFVGFNDGLKDGRTNIITQYMMTREFIIKHHGGVAAIPHYTAGYVDTEALERAKSARDWVWLPFAYVRHRWHGDDKEMDLSYSLQKQRRAANKAIFEDRKLRGFPDDFEAIVA